MSRNSGRLLDRTVARSRQASRCTSFRRIPPVRPTLECLESRTVPSFCKVSLPPSSGAVGASPLALVPGDFNGDGRLDLAVFDGKADTWGNNVVMLLGHGDGSFSPLNSSLHPLSSPAGASPLALGPGDFNGDGRHDLAVLDATADTWGNNVVMLAGQGDGSFSPLNNSLHPLTTPAGPSPVALVRGDFNGDGRQDLAVLDGTADTWGNYVQTFLGNG